MAIQSFRGPQVCKIVGITYRQLDYWTRTNLITPSVKAATGSGSQREYSYQDLVALKTIKRLLDTGISLQRVRDAISYLQETFSERQLSEITLVADGGRIYACHDDQEVIDLFRRGQGVFAIALAPVVEDLEASLQSIGRRGGDEIVADSDALPDGPGLPSTGQAGS